jgi:hypothetical protein
VGAGATRFGVGDSADGGWSSRPHSPASALEWRGYAALESLMVLRATAGSRERRSLRATVVHDPEVAIEAHITLDASLEDEHAMAALATRVSAMNAKLTCIQLSRGVWARQVMLSAWIDSAGAPALERARELCRDVLAATGLRARRIKLEAELTGGEALGAPSLYLEHHVKVRLPSGFVGALGELAARHAAHLSRNAFLRHAGGVEERFLTQRFPAGALTESAAALNELLDGLAATKTTPVLKLERERVLHDDNLSIDDGWIEEVPG